MFTNSSAFSRPDVLCFATFLMVGVTAVLAFRNLKAVVAGCITLPIAGLCGGAAYIIALWLYGAAAGTLYGLATFALTGLIVLQILRWIDSLDGH